MFAWGALLNFVIFPGSDYMYMVNDPLELNLNFPYQILYALLLVVYIFIFYLIYYFKQKLNNRRITKLVYQNITKLACVAWLKRGLPSFLFYLKK